MRNNKYSDDGLDDVFRALLGRAPSADEIKMAYAINEIVERTGLDPFVVTWIANKRTGEQLVALMTKCRDRIWEGVPSLNERWKLFRNSLEHSEVVQELVRISKGWVRALFVLLTALVATVLLSSFANAGTTVTQNCHNLVTQPYRKHARKTDPKRSAPWPWIPLCRIVGE